MTKTKKFILIPILCLTLILSLFAFIPKNNISKSFASNEVNEIITDYSFSSSNFYVPFARCLDNGFIDMLNIRFNIHNEGTTTFINLDCGMFCMSNTYNYIPSDRAWDDSYTGYPTNYSYNSNVCILDNSQCLPTNFSLTQNIDFIVKYLYLIETDIEYIFYVRKSPNFNSDVAFIQLSSWTDNSSCGLNIIKFITKSGDYLLFEFNSLYGISASHYEYTFKEDYNDILFSDITYSLIDFNSLSSEEQNNLIYNYGFNAGSTDGYNKGFNAGSTDGYNKGYDKGSINGYNKGYNQGLSNAENFTFSNLIGSVIDVPIQSFLNLLNFNILGVNIVGLVTGLITVALVLFLVRKIGGK